MKIKVTQENIEQTSQAVNDEMFRILEAGKPVSIEVKEWKESRSLSQNSTYWMWLSEISEQILKKINQNHDTETLHEYFKQCFCPQKEITLGKKEIIIASTKRLDSGEMCHYLNQIEKWCIDRGFKITIPINSEYQELINRQNL